MTVEDLFGLIVRIGGTSMIAFSSLDVFAGLAKLAGVLPPVRYTATVDFNLAAIYLLPGLILFLAADAITRLAYRKRRNLN